ncbi:ankyrin repeat-containing domain protein [Plectosphaerella cucumerina]|uniref:Ankyrin repeat-containing domain protein n=1 Tax=Plectosphaerella cucumerina TaxID=40658 RepID=A0A8K0X331_9PEZI|nr:ankyrin repeat-containing domain protein [Plectosphaerella cucumerina]
MIVLGLEVVYPQPGDPVPAKYLRKFDIICVHGLGRDSIRTWHHETAGKTWISDPEFLGSLSLSARVLTYTYNSELGANMSSASIGLHASELLELITICYNQTGGGPTIFVAHGFGGIIVKKAIEMYSTSTHYPVAEDTTAGVIFLGTPHSTNDTDSILKALQATASLHTKHGTKPNLPSMRDYAVSVRDTNAALRSRMIDKLEIANVTEKLPTLFGPEGAESSHRSHVVPASCARFRVGGHQVIQLDRDHLGLASYASPADPDFRSLHSFLTVMSNRAKMNVKPRHVPMPMMPPLHARSPPPPMPRPGPPPMPMPSPSPPPPYGEKIDDDKRILPPPPGVRVPMRSPNYQDWARRKETEALVKARTEFEESLSGWSQTSTGSHILPIPGSCAWLRSHDSFKLWLDAPMSTAVLCHGPPGSGKTHWAKSVVNHLAAARPGDVVVSFFCDGAETGDTEPPILESLIYQIVCQRPEWFREVPSRYTERRFSSPRRTMESLSDVLLHLKRSRTSNTVFFVIDAIDECETEFTRKLLRHVSAFVDRFGLEKSPAGTNPQQDEPGRARFKFFFTSRQTDVVRQAPCFTGRGPGLSPQPRDICEDIAIYVDTHVDRLDAPPAEADGHKQRIKSQAGIFFPYAAFSCAELLANPAALSDCPEGLARYYNRQILPMLQSVDDERFSLEALCIVCATYPGRLDRSQVLDGLRGHEKDRPMPDVLPLISQQCSRLIDTTATVWSLTHAESLYAHVLRLMPDGALHGHMARLCLRYLSAPCFAPAALPLNTMEPMDADVFMRDEHPFYHYAMSWPRFLKVSGDHTDKVMGAVVRFFSEDSPQFQTWCLCMTWKRHCIIKKMHPCTAMALTDRAELIRPFLPTSWGLSGPETSWEKDNAREVGRRKTGWEGLLPDWPRKGRPFISADVIDDMGRSPLHLCASRGDNSALAMFLSCPLLIDQRAGPLGETPLFMACRRYVYGELGSQEMEREPGDAAANLESARLLLEAGANPNISSYDGTRCLHIASRAEDPGLVDLLLKFGAEVNVCDIEGHTILEAATSREKSYLPVLQRLIDAGIDLDARYSDSCPPILAALNRRQLDVFEILAQHVSDINQRDVGGLAPIHRVIAMKSSELLPSILRRPDAQLDLLTKGPASNGDTALGIALDQNDMRAAQLLLAAGASPGYVPGMEEILPLSSAIECCQTPMLRLLLDYGAPINALDRKMHCTGKTALTIAIATSKENHVRLLLEHGADPTIEEAYNRRSALSWAVTEGNIAVIRMLLEHTVPPNVNYRAPDSPHVFFEIQDDETGPEIARLLLQHGADTKASFDESDKRNPVHELAEFGLVEVIKVLVEHDPSLLDMCHKAGKMCWTPLHDAAFNGNVAVVSYMIGKVPADTKSYWYEVTPFARACMAGQLEVAKLLYEKAPHVLEMRTYCGETPLMHACSESELKVARFLVEKGANIRATDDKGCSVIRRALEQHEEDAVQLIRLFVEHGLEPNEVVGSHGLTVLGEALRMSSLPAVRYLLSKGGDPLRCQLCLDGKTYRTALHVAAAYREPEAVRLLLQRAEVREHLADVDDDGENVLFVNPRRNGVRAIASSIFWASEEMRLETGRDVFAEMATIRCEGGRTAVDWALRGSHVLAPPEDKPRLRSQVRDYLAALVPARRTFEEHGGLLEALTKTLVWLDSGHDAQTIVFLQMILTVPEIIDGEDGFSSVTRHRWSCDECDEKFELMHVCRSCSDAVCTECVPKHEPGVHSYLAVAPPEKIDLNSAEMQAALDFLKVEFDAEQEEPVRVEVFREDPDSAATTLSLATMHAFGYLEIRRRAWSPYIGLARAVHERLEPWGSLIREQRAAVRDRVLGGEGSPERLREELEYFLGCGRRTAYQDEAALRYGWILEAIGFCFQEPEGSVRGGDDGNDDGNDSDGSVTIV